MPGTNSEYISAGQNTNANPRFSPQLKQLEAAIDFFNGANENSTDQLRDNIIPRFNEWRQNNPEEYNARGGKDLGSKIATEIVNLAGNDLVTKKQLQLQLIQPLPQRTRHTDSDGFARINTAINAFKEANGGPTEDNLATLVVEICRFRASNKGEFDKRQGAALAGSVFKLINTCAEGADPPPENFTQRVFLKALARNNPDGAVNIGIEDYSKLKIRDSILNFFKLPKPFIKNQSLLEFPQAKLGNAKHYRPAIPNAILIFNENKTIENLKNVLIEISRGVSTELAELDFKFQPWIDQVLKPAIAIICGGNPGTDPAKLITDCLYEGVKGADERIMDSSLKSLFSKFGIKFQNGHPPKASTYLRLPQAEQNQLLSGRNPTCALPGIALLNQLEQNLPAA